MHNPLKKLNDKRKRAITLKVVQAIVICVIKKEEAIKIMNLKIKNRGCEA